MTCHNCKVRMIYERIFKRWRCPKCGGIVRVDFGKEEK